MGQDNIACVSLAHTLGMAAKFTGSGGALVCLPRPSEYDESPQFSSEVDVEGIGFWLSDEREDEAIRRFAQLGYEMVRIQVV